MRAVPPRAAQTAAAGALALLIAGPCSRHQERELTAWLKVSVSAPQTFEVLG